MKYDSMALIVGVVVNIWAAIVTNTCKSPFEDCCYIRRPLSNSQKRWDFAVCLLSFSPTLFKTSRTDNLSACKLWEPCTLQFFIDYNWTTQECVIQKEIDSTIWTIIFNITLCLFKSIIWFLRNLIPPFLSDKWETSKYHSLCNWYHKSWSGEAMVWYPIF